MHALTRTFVMTAADLARRSYSLGSALRVPRIDLGDLLVAFVQGLGGLPVLDEHALDHLWDDVRVQPLAGGRRRRARIAHRHPRLCHLDEVHEGRLFLPERAVEEPLVDGDPATSGRLDD